MIGQLHQDLLRHSTKDERHRGHYKALPNHVSAFDADGKGIGIVFGLAIAFTATTFISTFFNMTAGAAF